MCLIEPDTASKALNRFGKFLRGNIDSLSTKECIPFSKELEHVQNYVYLQKLRFGERLNVKFEIETKDFPLPALTVQPIVENAIRHGTCKREEGGTVTIKTLEYDTNIEIQVSDNGVGFNVQKLIKNEDLRKEHVGLANIISRVEKQCKGTVNIESTEGVGTTVHILMPKE